MSLNSVTIPPKFWQQIGFLRFQEILRSGWLNAEETQTVYRMNDLEPPAYGAQLEVFVSKNTQRN